MSRILFLDPMGPPLFLAHRRALVIPDTTNLNRPLDAWPNSFARPARNRLHRWNIPEREPLEGPHSGVFNDAFYFAITSYTTLGIGDLYPTGAFRIISGIEALNGLVMVGWSASMTYLYMEKFWHLRARKPNNPK